MSIQSEIDRIAGAKPILGNYLQQNGVAVPSGATLDEMALLLADVIGTKSQEKIVNLSMASGNQVITPDDGYTLSKVTVTKPDTLIPDNIKKDVNIGGVVGSMSGGGAPSLQSKSVTYTANGTNTITPDEGYDGLSSVDVTVDVVVDVPFVTVTFKATQYGYEINSPGEDTFAEMKRIVISALVDGNISLDDMYSFSNQWGGMVFPFDVAVPQGSSVTICDNSEFGGGVSATNALVLATSANGIKSVFTVYNITDGATITIDVS